MNNITPLYINALISTYEKTMDGSLYNQFKEFKDDFGKILSLSQEENDKMQQLIKEAED